MMHALLLAAALSTAPATPIHDSVDRVVASYSADHQAGRVSGFEQEGVRKPKKEKFFGATNLLMGAGLGLSAWYDVKTTYEMRDLLGPNPQRSPDDPNTLVAVHTFPQSDGSTRIVTLKMREKTEFYRASVLDNDRASTWRRKAYVNAPVWVASHYLRRSPNKILKVGGWLLPVFAGGIQMKVGFDNKRQTDEMRSLLH